MSEKTSALGFDTIFALELKETEKLYGIASLWIGGGQGIPVIIKPGSNNYLLLRYPSLYYILILRHSSNPRQILRSDWHPHYLSAPCIVEECSLSAGRRYLKLLRRLFNNGDIGKKNKQTLLDRLQQANLGIKEIVRKTGFTASKIRNEYNFHEGVDRNLITEHTSIKMANWIIQLKLEKEVEILLFERAGLPQRNPQRLTYESMKLINQYFKVDRNRFDLLTPSEQEKVLKQAINFKGIVISWLKTRVDDIFNSR
jgi:hypothetical protein